jgi:molecular chaperone DnaK
VSATIDYGIDLGTTNSSIGCCRRGEVRIFQTNDLMNVTPSVIYIGKSGRMLVGKKAYDTWVQDPLNTQAEFKRWMGYSDRLTFPASGRDLSAEELSAELLKSLRADAERQTQEAISAAVITVPAAFGSLQCDATGRAARLAGLVEAPLLQEPIAAAIAYGASPGSRDQRWMVFDLGGGTLDIAVVSTRNGRLAVLEHQGNNRLGGKDVDRLIAETMLLVPLGQAFKLPDAQADPTARRRLMRALLRHAEQAKISLSTAPEAIVDLFDLGDDVDGRPIELSITLRRPDVETTIAPVIEQCLDLARRALEGSRLAAADLDRILLVGGPTQMPALRAALTAGLGVRLDHSLDPMTVVAHGAALYASTIERTTAAPSVATSAAAAGAGVPAAPSPSGVVPVQLAYERASGTLQSPVAGVIDVAAAVSEIKIDAAGGFWTSGWLPVVDGAFHTDVLLHDVKPVTHYTLTARDKVGNLVRLEPAEFTVTYMLPMAAPPLPHTIAVELSTSQGVTQFEPVFRRHSPLPAEARKTYRADRTLRPSELSATLPIKFWEIEVSDDPQERWWAGCVHVRADWIKRPIPEGAELELTIKIDMSRKLSVELFIPLLNQSFTHDVYLPDPPSARSQVQEQLDLCFERLNRVREEVYANERDELVPQFERVELMAEDIAERINADLREGCATDPDASLDPTDSLRKLRLQLTRLEEQLNLAATSSIARRLRWQVPYIDRTVTNHGTDSDRALFARLRDQYDRYTEADDARGLTWVHGQIWAIHRNVVEDKLWYWQECLTNLKEPGRKFLNQEQAARAITDADAANARGDLPALRSAVRRGWALQPGDQVENAMEQAAPSGLRAT